MAYAAAGEAASTAGTASEAASAAGGAAGTAGTAAEGASAAGTGTAAGGAASTVSYGGGGGGGSTLAGDAGLIGGIISSIGSLAGAGKPRVPKAHRIAAPLWEQAFAHYLTSVLARNMNTPYPTFGQFLQSGGTLAFPISDPGMTPLQAERLGLVGPGGSQIPFVQPGAQGLTPAQVLYLGQQQAKQGNAQTAAARAFQASKRIERIGARPSTPGREARITRLQAREQRLLNKSLGQTAMENR